jgi:tetratricopeptide (TPR) repeat protein
VERLLKDLAPLGDQVWLVIDDVHELSSDQALRQLELLVMRAPEELRFVLATRHDVRLSLHRLRLEGELTEIRADDLRFTAAEARALFAAAGVREMAQYDVAPAARAGLGDELRALALVKIGDTETWTGRLDQAESHLEQGIALARRIGRPYLEFMGLVYRAEIELNRPCFPRAAELGRQAIDLAERHGWTDDPDACNAFMTLGSALAWQGRLDEAEAWVQRAVRTI